jgi:hypothetical protein
MGNEVKIRLTDAQKAKIKEATGQNHEEVRMAFPGASPAVSSPSTSSPLKAQKALRAHKALRAQKALKAQKALRAH